MNIATRITIVSVGCVVFFGLVVTGLWYRADARLRTMHDELVTSQAVMVGEATALQVAAMRTEYVQQLVARLKPTGVAFSQAPADGEAPLPAVFVKHVSEEMKKQAGTEGVGFSLRSGWNINPSQAIDTDFERRGWQDMVDQQQQLKEQGRHKQQAYKPYWERGNAEDGTPVIRVMTPDLASAKSCVTCHNALEGNADVLARRATGQRKTFQLGDLMGAVVTTVPLRKSEAIVARLADTQASVSNWIWCAVGICVLASTIVSFFLGRRIARPIRQAANFARQIAAGDLQQRCDVRAAGETTELIGAMNEMRDNLFNVAENLAANAATLGTQSTQLLASSNDLATGANGATQQSSCVAAAAEQMSVNMNNVANTTDGVASNVQEIARAVKEMTDSIKEVAASAERGASVAGSAAKLVSVSTERVGELNSSANEIGKVIQVIEEIAEQTNLLALNATIEAARAGEAGKGFAVVATEVKELARQTAAATDDIRGRIKAIQGSTSQAIDAIREISDVINNVSEVSQVIASAVEEQSITTRQMAENVSRTAADAEVMARGIQESASASQDITCSIATVDTVLKQTAASADQSRQSGEQFSYVADELASIVAHFKTKQTAATAV